MPNIISLYKNSFSAIQKNIWILSIAMFINRCGSMVLLFASLYLTNQLHFTIAEAGIVMSFYGIGSVLGSYAGGWLTDRYHFFNILILSLLCSGSILLMLIFASSPFSVTCIIFGYAFTADIFRPANSKAIAVYSTPENRTRSVSLVRLAINLGFSVGPAMGGFVALYLGYKWLFVIDACTGFLAAAMLYFYLPREAETKQQTEATSNKLEKSNSAYRDVRYLVFILMVAVYGISFFQLFASVPQYFSRVCKYSEDTIGLLMALNGILVVLIEMPFVAALEKSKKQFRFIIAGTLCIPVAMFCLQIGNAWMLWSAGYIVVVTLSEILAMPFLMSHALSSSPVERQGQYAALYAMAFGMANIFAPLVGLGLADNFGFSITFNFFMGMGLFSAIGFWWLKTNEQKKDQAEINS